MQQIERTHLTIVLTGTEWHKFFFTD